jgi:signal transduction histidine kinase
VEIIIDLHTVRPITGNPTQLKQVILNLLLNAMEAMPHGGTLTIELRSDQDGIILAITDTGIGMDRETLERIFEPFYSTKGEGTGLGLSVSYGIIQGHHGELRVASEPGQGSQFTIWQPYDRPQE